MKHFFLTILLLFLSSAAALVDAEIPKSDLAGSADHQLVGRFQGSSIVSFAKKEFDEATFPLSVLKPLEDQRDSHNNVLIQPEQSIHLEGRRTRLVYLNPEGVSPLEVLRNYEMNLQKKRGKILHSCAKSDCGGSHIFQ